MKSTPVGPVAGGIMGCFLILALGVYCYRHHVHRHSHHYISTLPDNANRISHYYNDEEQEATDDISTGECKLFLSCDICVMPFPVAVMILGDHYAMFESCTHINTVSAKAD